MRVVRLNFADCVGPPFVLQHRICTQRSTPILPKRRAFESPVDSSSITPTMDPQLLELRSESYSPFLLISSPLSNLRTSPPPPSSPPEPSDLSTTLYTEQNEAGDDNIDDTSVEGREKRLRKRLASNIAASIESVLRAMRDVGWSLDDFVHAYIEEKDHRGTPIICNFRGYATPAIRQERLLETLRSDQFMQLRGTPMDVSKLRKELKDLRNTRYFGPFDRETKVEDIDLDAVDASIARVAPQWHIALHQLLHNQRVEWDSYSSQPKENDEGIAGKIFMITAMVCMSQAKQRSNFLPSMLDIYLLGSGVKRRAFSTLAGFGICRSYKTANALMKDVAKASQVRPD